MRKSNKYSPELFELICKRLEEGETLASISTEQDMPSRQAFYTWVETKEGAIDRYVRAREKQADSLAEEIVHISNTATDAQLGRLQMDARKWFASKVAPKKYGEKTDITSNGNTIAVAPIKWADE
jgi:hypothetical protein